MEARCIQLLHLDILFSGITHWANEIPYACTYSYNWEYAVWAPTLAARDKIAPELMFELPLILPPPVPTDVAVVYYFWHIPMLYLSYNDLYFAVLSDDKIIVLHDFVEIGLYSNILFQR